MTQTSRSHARSDVTRTLRGVPLESLVSMALSPANLALGTRVNLALARLDQYTSAATVQNAHMWELHREANAARGEKDYVRFRRLESQAAADLHFYFVSWDAVAKTLSSLRHPPIGVGTPDRIYNRHRHVLEHYQVARNHFEHYDERLPLGHRSRDEYRRSDSGQSVSYERLLVPNDGLVRYYDDSWDVRPETVETLRGIVDEFQNDLRKELTPLARKTMLRSHESML